MARQGEGIPKSRWIWELKKAAQGGARQGAARLGEDFIIPFYGKISIDNHQLTGYFYGRQ